MSFSLDRFSATNQQLHERFGDGDLYCEDCGVTLPDNYSHEFCSSCRRKAEEEEEEEQTNPQQPTDNMNPETSNHPIK